MRIEDARAAVIARVQNFRPSAEFPVPNSLLDFMIFQEAAFQIAQRRIVVPADWMFTQFECQTATANPNSCGADYQISLPFTPANMYDAIGLVTLADPAKRLDKAITMRGIPYNSLAISGGMVDPPSVEKPAYTLKGQTMYLLGRKSFKNCKVSISGVVGALNEGFECSVDANVPVAPGGGEPVIMEVASKVIQSLYGIPEDKVEDNESDQREPNTL